MSEKISRKTSISILFISLAGQIAWAVENQYYNVFLYNAIAPVPFYISIMVAVSAVIATITSILIGALSDLKGKRKPFLLIGFIFWTITTAIFPFASVFSPVILAVAIAILFDSIMTFFGSTAYDAAFVAYVADVTSLENRAKAIGLVQMMTLVSILLIYGVSGFIISALGYYAFFYLVGIIVGIFGITGAIITKEPENLEKLDIGIYEHIKNTFKTEQLRKYKSSFLILIGGMIYNIAFNIFFPYILIYLEHYIGLTIEISSILIFIAMLVSIVASYPIGILIDKFGRKRIGIISILFYSFFLFLFALFFDPLSLLITGILWIFFMTIWSITLGAWTKDLYPEESRGQFSGYVILFSVLIPMTIGPVIGGWLSSEYGAPIVIDGIPGFIPPPLIFIVGALVMLLTILPLIPAKEIKTDKSNKLELSK
jgi:MFS family permease